MRRIAPALLLVVACATLLSGCLAAAVVGTGAAVVGGTVKATGAVVGAGFDAVTTSDEEARAKRKNEERRCERRQRQGKDC